MPTNKPADPTPPAEPKAVPVVEKPAALVPAAESGDPDVHRLLAERQVAQSTLDAATPSADVKAKAEAARKQIAAVDDQLAKLGVTAK